MIWKTALQYARFWLLLALVSGQLTEEEKGQILDLHNQYRSMVIPEAADMLHMTWDESLSSTAQDYANRCIWEHNYDMLEDLGENLYITTGHLSMNKSMAKWFDEHKDYDYDTNTCNSDMCGHYTQVVWAKSTTVGCASNFCKTVQNIHYVNAKILVCNYFPQGNIEGKQPYEAGEPCSKCPHVETVCVDNICAIIESTTKGTTETRLSGVPQTEPVNSGGFTKLSVATLFLPGLMVSFIF